MEKASIFLTTEEAVRAICIDFRQYDPQTMLFAELMRLISNNTVHLKREPGKTGAWIKRPGSPKMKWLDGQALKEFMCDAVSKTHWEPDQLAAVCSRVFQTRVQPVTDENTGETGMQIQTNMETYVCRQCGNCCRSLDYHSEVREADVQRWKQLDRHDILKWVEIADSRGATPTYRIWVSPKTGQAAEICPFLEKDPTSNRWQCRIHDVKPAICRQYPITRKHALMTGCPGFDKPGPKTTST